MSATMTTDDHIRAAYNCPDWCITSAREHGDDDAGRPLHDGPVIVEGYFSVVQTADEPPVAYLHEVGGELSAQQCRELAAAALTAAQWLEANR